MTMRHSILIIDEDEEYREILSSAISETEYHSILCEDIYSARKILSDKNVLLILIGIKESEDLNEKLSALKEDYPYSEIIVFSNRANMKSAFNAMKNGAFNFLVKSPNIEEFIPHIDKAYKKAYQNFKYIRTKNIPKEEDINENIIGGRKIQEILKLVDKVSPSVCSILLLGETGVGKELIAKQIHKRSKRKDKPFIAINCGAIPDTLLENELFGHVKGAFTDAHIEKTGLFEEADGGTLFLDEVSELPIMLQVKLLRVLETGTFRRLGSIKETSVDVRVISASNINLSEIIRKPEGKKIFRPDIFYRISMITIRIPSLRERKEDIPLLVEHFLKKAQEKLFCENKTINSEGMRILCEYDWPGNIRELKNVVERVSILSDTKEIKSGLIANSIAETETVDTFMENLYQNNKLPTMEEVEMKHIKYILEQTGQKLGLATEILNISEKCLVEKIQKYGLKVT